MSRHTVIVMNIIYLIGLHMNYKIAIENLILLHVIGFAGRFKIVERAALLSVIKHVGVSTVFTW